jgi:primosomal protein N' (replication factor Y) (superfamily II helicase)
MFAKIIPSILLPINIDTQEFTYKIPEKIEKDIKIGQIVEIDFKNKKIQGLVISIENKSEINKIKEINKIISKDFVFTKQQINLINFLHENYFINKSLAFKTIIPQIPKRIIKK